MKKKLLGICICLILIASAVLPVAGRLNEKNTPTNEGMELVPVVDFIDPPIFNNGNIPLILNNYGVGTASQITWEMEVSDGGLFQGKLFFPKTESGEIESLSPGESYETDYV